MEDVLENAQQPKQTCKKQDVNIETTPVIVSNLDPRSMPGMTK